MIEEAGNALVSLEKTFIKLSKGIEEIESLDTLDSTITCLGKTFDLMERITNMSIQHSWKKHGIE